jgi:hypothetical protein
MGGPAKLVDKNGEAFGVSGNPLYTTHAATIAETAIGATTDAAVVTDANGTLSSKLRGIIKLLVDKITVKTEPAASTLGTAPSAAVKTVASTGTPEVVGTNATTFKSITFLPYNAARALNTGRVWIQFTSTNGDEGIPLGNTEGNSITFTAPEGKHYDLSQFYVDVETNADGVMYIIQQ